MCCFLQSNHPRLKADVRSVTLNDLRETDDGIYSVSFGHNDVTDIIDLKVLGKTILPYDTVKKKNKQTLLIMCCISV